MQELVFKDSLVAWAIAVVQWMVDGELLRWLGASTVPLPVKKLSQPSGSKVARPHVRTMTLLMMDTTSAFGDVLKIVLFTWYFLYISMRILLLEGADSFEDSEMHPASGDRAFGS